MSSLKCFQLKNTFIKALQYLINVVTIYNTVFYIEFKFKPKTDPKVCTLEKFKKPVRNILKTSGHPVKNCVVKIKIKT